MMICLIESFQQSKQTADVCSNECEAEGTPEWIKLARPMFD